MPEIIKVLLADDHPRSRSGLKALLETSPQVRVVGEAGDGREAMRLVEEQQPDVVVLDARMPVMDGLEVARRVKSRWPEMRVVLLTMYKAGLAEALMTGADAFLEKGCPIERLWEALTKPSRPITPLKQAKPPK